MMFKSKSTCSGRHSAKFEGFLSCIAPNVHRSILPCSTSHLSHRNACDRMLQPGSPMISVKAAKSAAAAGIAQAAQSSTFSVSQKTIKGGWTLLQRCCLQQCTSDPDSIAIRSCLEMFQMSESTYSFVLSKHQLSLRCQCDACEACFRANTSAMA